LIRWGALNLLGDWVSRPIALRALAPSAGLAFPVFQHVILAAGEARTTLEFSLTPEALAGRLQAAANSIGITGFPATDDQRLKVLALAASPTDPAYAPTPENVHTGSYPLRMPLYVAFRRQSAPKLRQFLKFHLSDEGAAALAPAHFVPLPLGIRNQLVFELEEMK
jgi:phosphate transport system substrate-binding protein